MQNEKKILPAEHKFIGGPIRTMTGKSILLRADCLYEMDRLAVFQQRTNIWSVDLTSKIRQIYFQILRICLKFRNGRRWKIPCCDGMMPNYWRGFSGNRRSWNRNRRNNTRGTRQVPATLTERTICKRARVMVRVGRTARSVVGTQMTCEVDKIVHKQLKVNNDVF